MAETKPARVLVIAGSDSSGGAGIQADIKTLTALGVYAATAVTAVTVQDTTGVHAVHAIPLPLIREQIVRVLGDIGADAIKTGMLGSDEIVRDVAKTLRALAGSIPTVIDPVMVAKGGAALLAEDAVDALRDELLPLATLLTPNAPEAERLTGLAIKNETDQVEAGKRLLAQGAKAALVKGGHLEGTVIKDVLVSRSGIRVFTAPRVETRSTHGTGCTLASACAAGLAQGLTVEASVVRAHAFVQQAIRTAPGFGRGHGPLNHLHNIPT